MATFLLLIISLQVLPQEKIWVQAQNEVIRKYPVYRFQIRAVQRPRPKLKLGVWYEEAAENWIYGLTRYNNGNLEVIVAITMKKVLDGVITDDGWPYFEQSVGDADVKSEFSDFIGKRVRVTIETEEESNNNVQ